MTTASTLPEIKTLEPDASVALWLKGKDEWNKWVEENPHYNINFSDVDFQLYRSDCAEPIFFESFRFPIGNVNFSHAKFGDGDVDFSGAVFCDCNVSFFCAEFGNGEVNFSNAEFGNGDVIFFGAQFGNGIVGFTCAKFGDGNVSFSNANFGDGNVDFYRSEFGDGNVIFTHAKFGHGLVDFSCAVFGDGKVDFSHSKFSNGVVGFADAKFGDGNVDFSYAEFGDGNVDFSYAKFSNGDFLFSNMTCRARFTLEQLEGELKSLSFRGATFSNTVSLSGLKVNSMIDLVNTKLTNQLSLHGLECQLKRTRNRFGVKKAIDPADAERANRAKELAEANKHYALALRFHADEMRAKRWQSGTGGLSSTLDLIFDLLCNYGQSVFRPAMLWVFSIFAFVLPYAAFATDSLTSVSQAFKLLIFSLSNSLPFLTSAGTARTEGLGKLFDENITYSAVLPLMMAQGVVTVILIFLIGLGLRNRFRL